MNYDDFGADMEHLGRLKWLLSNSGRPFSIIITPESCINKQSTTVTMNMVPDSVRDAIVSELPNRISEIKANLRESALDLAERKKK